MKTQQIQLAKCIMMNDPFEIYIEESAVVPGWIGRSLAGIREMEIIAEKLGMELSLRRDRVMSKGKEFEVEKNFKKLTHRSLEKNSDSNLMGVSENSFEDLSTCDVSPAGEDRESPVDCCPDVDFSDMARNINNEPSGNPERNLGSSNNDRKSLGSCKNRSPETSRVLNEYERSVIHTDCDSLLVQSIPQARSEQSSQTCSDTNESLNERMNDFCRSILGRDSKLSGLEDYNLHRTFDTSGSKERLPSLQSIDSELQSISKLENLQRSMLLEKIAISRKVINLVRHEKLQLCSHYRKAARMMKWHKHTNNESSDHESTNANRQIKNCEISAGVTTRGRKNDISDWLFSSSNRRNRSTISENFESSSSTVGRKRKSSIHSDADSSVATSGSKTPQTLKRSKMSKENSKKEPQDCFANSKLREIPNDTRDSMKTQACLEHPSLQQVFSPQMPRNRFATNNHYEAVNERGKANSDTESRSDSSAPSTNLVTTQREQHNLLEGSHTPQPKSVRATGSHNNHEEPMLNQQLSPSTGGILSDLTLVLGNYQKQNAITDEEGGHFKSDSEEQKLHSRNLDQTEGNLKTYSGAMSPVSLLRRNPTKKFNELRNNAARSSGTVDVCLPVKNLSDDTFSLDTDSATRLQHTGSKLQHNAATENCKLHSIVEVSKKDTLLTKTVSPQQSLKSSTTAREKKMSQSEDKSVTPSEWQDEWSGTCPVCGYGEVGQDMVACDICNNWYHFSCVGYEDTVEDWFCRSCINAEKVAKKHRRSKHK